MLQPCLHSRCGAQEQEQRGAELQAALAAATAASAAAEAVGAALRTRMCELEAASAEAAALMDAHSAATARLACLEAEHAVSAGGVVYVPAARCTVIHSPDGVAVYGAQLHCWRSLFTTADPAPHIARQSGVQEGERLRVQVASLEALQADTAARADKAEIQLAEAGAELARAQARLAQSEGALERLEAEQQVTAALTQRCGSLQAQVRWGDGQRASRSGSESCPQASTMAGAAGA